MLFTIIVMIAIFIYRFQWFPIDMWISWFMFSRRRPASSTGWRSFGPTPPRCATASGSNKMRINALMFRGMSVGRMPHQYCRT